MARIHEYKGKELLAEHGIAVPRGTLLRRGVDSAAALGSFLSDVGLPAVVKAQAWTTGRLEKGLIRFAKSEGELREAAEALFEKTVEGFSVDEVLVEERVGASEEFFFSYYIDDADGLGRYLFARGGGSGIEERFRKHGWGTADGKVHPGASLRPHHVREVLRKADIHGPLLLKLSRLVHRAIETAIAVEARSLEINPIIENPDGKPVAADCRVSVDDYAVFRHPELEIEIARDLANPPTDLDRIAYAVESGDYRGTFYFTQLAQGFSIKDRYVGFHGAGGGGSMMSMDALMAAGFRPANFCDTSGNPPASKVYRAARIILSQPGIVGYFGSGSGVASQEQIHSARGLVKAFREVNMDLPVVVRLGGNMEDEAIHVLEDYTRDLPTTIRGFTKDADADRCAAEFRSIVENSPTPRPDRDVADEPPWLNDKDTYRFDCPTGTVHYHHPTCLTCASKACVSSCVPGILQLADGKPELAITQKDAKAGKCIECLACEVECRRHGAAGGYVRLPMPETSTSRP